MLTAVWVCSGCGTVYDPGPAQACPDCHIRDHTGREVDVAQVHRCQGCRTAYVLPVTVCPRCHGVDIRAEEYVMPKNTVHGGASNAAAEDTGAPPPPEPRQGVPSSPGDSSSTSPAKPPTKPATRPAARRKPARPTGSPSGKGQTGSSSANLMGGGTTVSAGADEDTGEEKDEKGEGDQPETAGSATRTTE